MLLTKQQSVNRELKNHDEVRLRRLRLLTGKGLERERQFRREKGNLKMQSTTLNVNKNVTL